MASAPHGQADRRQPPCAFREATATPTPSTPSQGPGPEHRHPSRRSRRDALGNRSIPNGLTTSVLAAANGLSAEHRVIAGTRLRLPAAAAALPVGGPVGISRPPDRRPDRRDRVSVRRAAVAGDRDRLAGERLQQRDGQRRRMPAGSCRSCPAAGATSRTSWAPDPLNPASPADNVRAGCILLRQLLRESGGDQTIAVAAYYQGMSSVRRIGMLPETRRYVASVMALRSRFGG